MKKRGFTLIELIVSLAIMSVLIGVISLIFNVNIKLTNDTYIDEINYKHSTNAILYIENVIRRADKIEVLANDECNLRAYIPNNENGYSTYSFKVSKANDNKNYLYAIIDNLKKGNKGGTVRITECKDIFINYDDLNKTVKIIINNNDINTRYETLISLGDRL